MLKIIQFVLMLLVIVWIGFSLGPTAIQDPRIIFIVAGGALLLILSLKNFEFALMLILFVIPFSIQANVGQTEGNAPIDVGVDDFFIFYLGIIWLVYLSKERKPPFISNPLTLPFIFYFAACIITFIPMIIFQKGSPLLSLLHLIKWYEYIFIYFVMIRTLETREQIVRFCVLSIIGAVLISCVQILQIMREILSGSNDFVHRATATFNSNGILGAYYVLFVSIVISFLITAKTLRMRLILGGFAVMMSFTLFYTFARAAYLGFVVALIFLGFFHRRMFLIFSFLLLALVPSMASKAVGDRIKMTVQMDRAQLQKMMRIHRKYYKTQLIKYGKGKQIEVQLDESSMERLKNWRRAETAIYENLVTGTGYWSGRFIGIFGFSTAHNFYLTTLVETGVLGFLCFIWIAGAIIHNSLIAGRYTQDVFYLSLGRGLAAGFIGVLVHAGFGETFEDFRLTGPLWILCALMVCAKRLDEEGYRAILSQRSAVPQVL